MGTEIKVSTAAASVTEVEAEPNEAGTYYRISVNCPIINAIIDIIAD